MTDNYIVNEEILEKYAKVFVNFGLNKGEGIKKGQKILLQVPECAKPILKHLYREVLKSGGIPIIEFYPDDMATEIYEYGSDEQISYIPKHLLKGKVDEIDGSIFIIATKNPKELSTVEPKKLMLREKITKEYRRLREIKETAGKFSWTLGLYGTKEMAKEANMSLEEYWEQIIKACYLKEEDPVMKWKEIQDEIERVLDTLNSLEIDKVHIESKNIDLWIKIGENRKWLGGRGCNIPSFEIFTSPDWRGTNGHIEFSEPLYRYGNLIEGIKMDFKDGIVTHMSAKKGEELLKEVLNQENANKIGEFSLTDCRLSKINKFMAETLYDENVGKEFGNTHIAIGSAYKDSYDGDIAKVKKEKFKELGFNESPIHIDIVSTKNRTVRAYLKDGSEKIIYKDGQFTI